MLRNSLLGSLVAVLALTGCAVDSGKSGEIGPDESFDDNAADSTRSPTLMGAIASGETQEGRFSSGHRYLSWAFDAPAGSTVKLTARGVRPADLDTVLNLYAATSGDRPRGASLAFNDDFGGELSSYLEYGVTESGHFAALVRRYDYGTSGTVSLTLEISGGDRACGSRGLAPCADGEFCDHPVTADCGRADAPGVCRTIPDACIELYRPVCGCDGQTYSNSCFAAAAGQSVEHEGACEQTCGGIVGRTCPDGQYCDFPIATMCGAGDQTGTCRTIPTACPRIVRPVCGCDGSTHGNDCEAHAAGTSVSAEGACAPPPPPPTDCRRSGCGHGQWCSFCWGHYACIPDGALC